MPTERFKSAQAYRKWNAYRHIHDIPAPHLAVAIIAGRPHRVKHSELSLPEIHERGAKTNKQGEIEGGGGRRKRNFYGD